MAHLLKADGTREDISPKNGTDFTFAELYPLIAPTSRMIEIVYLADGQLMLLDEEGKFQDGEKNFEATHLLELAGGIPGDYVVGDVAIVGKEQIR